MAGHGVADWTALPDNLVKKIGGIFLSTDDLDYYAVFRAVCGGWRRTTYEQFMPSNKWIVLEHSMKQYDSIVAGAVTLFNLSTGRCVEKKLCRAKERYFFIATEGGLVVLGQRVRPFQIQLLNHLTGAMKRLRVHMPTEELSAVVVTDSPSLTVFTADLQNTLRWADESTVEGNTNSVFGDGIYDPGSSLFVSLRSMTSYNGDVFVTNTFGQIISTMPGTAEEERSARILHMNTTIAVPIPGAEFPQNLFYLVESEGKLLLVVSGLVVGEPVVYQVDTKICVLEPVRSIGSQALFVGKNRCISVDTSKVHGIKAGSIYFADLSQIRSYDGKHGAWKEKPKYSHCCSVSALWHGEGPFTQEELLAEYCRTIEESELQGTNYDENGYIVYFDRESE